MQPHEGRWFDWRNWSFAARLTLVVILVVMATVVGLTWSNIWTMRNSLSQEIGQDFESEAVNLKELVKLFFQEKATELEVLALADVIKNPVAEQNAAYRGSTEEILAQIQSLNTDWLAAADDDPLITQVTSNDPEVNSAAVHLAIFLANVPNHTELFVTDRYGATVAATARLLDYYQADEAWWQAAWNEGQGAVYISDPKYDESAKVTAFLIAVPLRDTDSGAVIGILRSTLRADELFDLIRDARFRQTGNAILFNRAGRVLFDPAAGPEEEIPRLPFDTWQQFISQPSGSTIVPDPSGEGELIFGHAILREEGFDPTMVTARQQATDAVARLGWIVAVRQGADEAFASANAVIRTAVVVGLIALGLASIVAVFTGRAVTRPLVRLSAIADQVGSGNLDVTLPSAGRDEIGRLAGSFRYMIDQLRQLIDNLADRTRHLETVAILSEHLSSILSLEELLAEVVNQVKDWFDYYYVHVYLIDQDGHNLIVAAGTGPAGEKMKATGHSIAVTAPTSLVARAARTGEIVRIDNVREEEDWLYNPLLPDTLSEMAVPIVLDETVVGVLDVQEDEIAGLDESDAALLYSLANQLAVAIRNARLFEEAQTALADAQIAQQRYLEQAWDATRMARRGIGRVQFNLAETKALSEAAIAQARQQALAQEKLSVVPLNGEDNDSEKTEAGSQALVAPIILQETCIGNLQLHGVRPDRRWTEGELAFIEAIVDQVAQVAETMRLLDETQERAARDRLVGQISDKLRRAPDVETLMKSAVDELARVFGPARTFVRFGSEEELAGTKAEGEENLADGPTLTAEMTDEGSSPDDTQLGHSSGNGHGEML
jgi:GAF domain-containing protein/HAMP domain-containing protein